MVIVDAVFKMEFMIFLVVCFILLYFSLYTVYQLLYPPCHSDANQVRAT